MPVDLWDKYSFRLDFQSPVLGMTPKTVDIFKVWQEGKGQEAVRRGQVALEDLPEHLAEEGTPEFLEEGHGLTGFPLEPGVGLYLLDYQVKGYLKEVAGILPEYIGRRKKGGDTLGVATVKRIIDQQVVVTPRRLYFQETATGASVLESEGIVERPLRAETLRGPRIAIARSEMVGDRRPVSLTGELLVLGSGSINQDALEAWLSYGAARGMCQWRNASYGRFTYTLKPKKTKEED